MKYIMRFLLKHKVSLLAVSICVAILVGFGIIFATSIDFYEDAARKMLDIAFQWRKGIFVKRDPSIVLVAIDDKSLDELGPWKGWPRAYFAKVFHNLSEDGAKVILPDVLVDEKSNFGKKDDSAYAKAAQETGKVIIPLEVNRIEKIRGLNATSVRSLFPVPVIRNSSPYTGFVTVYAGSDRYVRRMTLMQEHQGKTYYAASVAAVAKYYDVTLDSKRIFIKNDQLNIGPIRIPVEVDRSEDTYKRRYMTINYVDPQEEFPTISFSDVLTKKFEKDPQVGKGYFKDKIVAIGTTSYYFLVQGTDAVMTPYFSDTGFTPGVEVHLNSINTILTGQFIKRQPEWAAWLMLFVSLFLTAFFVLKFSQNKSNILIKVMSGGLIIAAFFMFILNGYWIDLVPVLAGIGFCSQWVGNFKGEYEDKERDDMEKSYKVQSILYRCLPTKMADEILWGQFSLPEGVVPILERMQVVHANQENRERIDLVAAKEIQQGLYPKTPPSIPGFLVSSAMVPDQQGGGNFYDYVSIGRDRLGMFVGDVSNEGIAASIFAAYAKNMLHTILMNKQVPIEVLQELRSTLRPAFVEKQMNIAFLFLTLDFNNREIVFCNAGLNYPIIFRKEKNECELLFVEGDVIGSDFDNTAFDQRNAFLNPGDILILYSDGIDKAVNRNGLEFGIDGIIQTCVRNSTLKPSEIVQKILDQVDAFAEGIPRVDDQTLIIIKAND